MKKVSYMLGKHPFSNRTVKSKKSMFYKIIIWEKKEETVEIDMWKINHLVSVVSDSLSTK